jgi:sugar-specific transcriptional regulator TrmB
MSAQGLELLRSLGFSDSQCRIYLALLESSEGESIDKVMTGLGVSPDEAERAIRLLVDCEAIKVISNRLEANPPKLFLSKLVERKRRESEQQLEDIAGKALSLQRLLEPAYWEKRRGIRPEDILEPLDDLADMEIRTVKMIGNAERYVGIFAQTFGWYAKVREELYRALDRGVTARILMIAVDEHSGAVSRELRDLGAEVRLSTQDWYPIRGTLVDSSELVFLVWATDKRQTPKPIYYRPHYTRNLGLIRVFADAFDKRWDLAKPI